MKILDCLPNMTKQYLSRVVDSIFKENIPKGNEEQLKEQIEQNIDYLENQERIRDALDFANMSRANRTLTRYILVSLMERPDLAAPENDLYQCVQNQEQWVIDKAKESNAFVFSDSRSIDIYQTILSVALEDEDISEEEFALLEKLRQKLNISRFEHYMLESRLCMFPKRNNELHTYEEIKSAQLELQKRGILFYCNRAEPNPLIALPEEISNKVGRIIGFEMRRSAQESLQDTLSADQLRIAARQQGLPVSGPKKEVSERLIESQCKPSEILGALSNDELYQICKKLQGVAVSGSKEQRINNIIEYFATLKAKPPIETKDSRELYYQYLEELAERNYKELRQANLIDRDRDIEGYFEEGTRYLFEKKLGCKLLDMDGTEHADGAVSFKNEELLLWDNKGKEKEYRFPKSHADQFLKYIRNSKKRVNVFLVVVPEIGPGAEQQARSLRYKNDSDTDVAIITAGNLKYLAENWSKFSKAGVFDLNVFNTTGILDRPTLEQQMKFILI
ncbi:MAG: hypothetical protein ACOC03_01275 [Desulfosalsimonas sp.]